MEHALLVADAWHTIIRVADRHSLASLTRVCVAVCAIVNETGRLPRPHRHGIMIELRLVIPPFVIYLWDAGVFDRPGVGMGCHVENTWIERRARKQTGVESYSLVICKRCCRRGHHWQLTYLPGRTKWMWELLNCSCDTDTRFTLMYATKYETLTDLLHDHARVAEWVGRI